MAKNILLINGANINLLGMREPHIYGHETMQDVENNVAAEIAKNPGVKFNKFHSNWEGALIDRIQEARTEGVDAIIINPGAFTHTSVALRDVLSGVAIPFVEVHISNIHAREEFRHTSYLSDKSAATIVGMGTYGYIAAADYLMYGMKEK
jgi:3-dehydroquinate dehydratase-2